MFFQNLFLSAPDHVHCRPSFSFTKSYCVHHVKMSLPTDSSEFNLLLVVNAVVLLSFAIIYCIICSFEIGRHVYPLLSPLFPLKQQDCTSLTYKQAFPAWFFDFNYF